MTPSSSRGDDDRDLWAKPAHLFRDLDGADGVVLAVSGGPDSTALMHLASQWRESGAPPRLAVATVDHGLRAEARAEAEAITAAARALGFAAETLVWTGAKPARAVQERARTARYALLADYAHSVGASHLVTAHTLDDQAETLLFRMARGSGVSGLGGMRSIAIRGTLTHARPLLHVRKNTLLDLCRQNNWPFLDDPGNADPRFARTRWRRLLPALAAEGLTPDRLGKLALRLSRAEAALDAVARSAEAEATLERGDRLVRLAMMAVAAQPDEIVVRVIEAAVVAVGQRAVRLRRVEALAADLVRAHRSAVPVRRTLGGCRILLDSGTVTVMPERIRARGLRGPETPPQTTIARDSDATGNDNPVLLARKDARLTLDR